MLLSLTIDTLKNIIINLFVKFFILFKLSLIFFIETFEALIIFLIIFCNIFLIFYSLFEMYLQLSQIIDHIHRYDNSKTIELIRTIFRRADIFLLFVIFLTLLSSLIMTMCKCVKKAKVTFALAIILLILFIEEYYNKNKSSH